MVMEFSDSVVDVDSYQINSSQWKQFSEVSRFNMIYGDTIGNCNNSINVKFSFLCNFYTLRETIFKKWLEFVLSPEFYSWFSDGCRSRQSVKRHFPPRPSVLLQVEAAGLECCPDGDVQRGVQCIISAGAVCGLQTECGAPLLPFDGVREPSLGAPHCETYRHAVHHQGLYGRCKEALHSFLHSWVRPSHTLFKDSLHFHCKLDYTM